MTGQQLSAGPNLAAREVAAHERFLLDYTSDPDEPIPAQLVDAALLRERITRDLTYLLQIGENPAELPRVYQYVAGEPARLEQLAVSWQLHPLDRDRWMRAFEWWLVDAQQTVVARGTGELDYLG